MIALTTANICSNPVQRWKNVRWRIDQAAWHGGRDGVVFGQEVAPEKRTRGRNRVAYSVVWRNRMAAAGKDTYGGTQEVPISVPRRGYRVLKTRVRVVFVHPGKARVSPNRYYTVVYAVRDDGLRVVFINWHPVSGWYKLRASQRAWRVEMWQAYDAAVRKEIAAASTWADVVFDGGDMNHHRPPLANNRQLPLLSRGLDHLRATPAPGVTFRVVTRKVARAVRRRGMDHPLLTVLVSVTTTGGKR